MAHAPRAAPSSPTARAGHVFSHPLGSWMAANQVTVGGVAAIEIVDGVPDEYLAASTKKMDDEQARQFEAAVRSMYEQMARITIQPRWARYYDFGTGRLPGFLAKLVQENQCPSGLRLCKPD